jgi:hypothetical protein
MIAEMDRNEIIDLLHNYSYTYDSKNIQAFADLFTDKFSWQYYVGIKDRTIKILHMENKGEFIEFLEERLGELTEEGILSRHFMTNTVLTERTKGIISAKTMVLIIWRSKHKEEPWIEDTGIYEDEFVKTDQGWRFAIRKLTSDNRVRWMI